MSKPEDFDRIDRPELRRPDPMAASRRRADAMIAYRNAYEALALRDPEAVRGLPHPDTAPDTFDVAAALEQLREVRGKLRAVPPRDVRG